MDDVMSILQSYSAKVYKIAYLYTNSIYDAEKIHEHIFLKYFRKARSFANEEQRKIWFIKFTANHAKNYVSDKSVDDDSPKNDFLSSITKVNNKYKILFHLFYYENITIMQLSQIFEKNEDEIKSKLNHAKALIFHSDEFIKAMDAIVPEISLIQNTISAVNHRRMQQKKSRFINITIKIAVCAVVWGFLGFIADSFVVSAMLRNGDRFSGAVFGKGSAWIFAILLFVVSAAVVFILDIKKSNKN